MLTRKCTEIVFKSDAVHESWYGHPKCYSSRASTVVPSPTPIRRPTGVFKDTETDTLSFRPSQKLDFELEMGFFLSKPVSFGETFDPAESEDYIFGFVLLNDWSSRDIQMYESNPLGPYHGKGFGTSISPWIITLDALQPFACNSNITHPALKHLSWKPKQGSTFDISLSVTLESRCIFTSVKEFN